MNPFQLSASALATIKLVLVVVAVLVATGFVGRTLYKANKLDRIEARDSQTATALKAMGKDAKKREIKEAAHFAQTRKDAATLSKELSNEKAKFDAAARAEYFRLWTRALRGVDQRDARLAD